MFFYRGDELYALRLGAYKAHFKTQDPYNNYYSLHDPPLLFNLEEDPAELFDIAEKYPEVLTEIDALRKEHAAKMIRGVDQLRKRG